MKIPKSPCEGCPKDVKCWKTCDAWNVWYKNAWRELQRRYGKRGKDHGYE